MILNILLILINILKNSKDNFLHKGILLLALKLTFLK